MIKSLLRSFGEKLREWFGPTKYPDDDPKKYLSVNANGRIYVHDLEGYLKAGNCFEKMEQTAKTLRERKGEE
jgi:hypothetical protein